MLKSPRMTELGDHDLIHFKMLKMWNLSSTLGRLSDEERERRRRLRELQSGYHINTLKAIKKRRELKKSLGSSGLDQQQPQQLNRPLGDSRPRAKSTPRLNEVGIPDPGMYNPQLQAWRKSADFGLNNSRISRGYNEILEADNDIVMRRKRNNDMARSKHHRRFTVALDDTDPIPMLEKAPACNDWLHQGLRDHHQQQQKLLRFCDENNDLNNNVNDAEQNGWDTGDYPGDKRLPHQARRRRNNRLNNQNRRSFLLDYDGGGGGGRSGSGSGERDDFGESR